jgi:hypothetical protein
MTIWWPEYQHYHVRAQPVSDSLIEKSRISPDDSILQELNTYENAITNSLDPTVTVEIAERVLDGELVLPNSNPIPITLPFDKKQFQQGLPGQQLTMAALTVPRLLLNAYQTTGREKFFVAARDVLQAWWRFEQESWLPVGLLWNDHAIAARIQVFVQFWSVYRHRSDFDPVVARALLESVDRNCQILVRPSHFTFATNHGVMQNLALLHAAVAFRDRSDARPQVETAIHRLSEQMAFYVGPTGIATEHSLGYQDLAVRLTANAIRYLTLLKQPIPVEWERKYVQALRFYFHVRLPDGTLPMYGDTSDAPAAPMQVVVPTGDGYEWKDLPASLAKPQEASLFSPLSGYAVWWNGLEHWPKPSELSQLVAGWANFISRAHKHADEMSVMFWAHGQQWWDNVGYWPYGVPPRERAISWDGSNAPHLENEGFNDERETRALRYGDAAGVRFLELERNRPDGYQVRRQIIDAGTNRWFVIDDSVDPAGRLSVQNWTLRRHMTIRRDSNGERVFTVGSAETDTKMRVVFKGGDGVRVDSYYGSEEPFSGWIVLGSKVNPTHAFRVTMPPNQWSLLSWNLYRSDAQFSSETDPRMIHWGGHDQWAIEWNDEKEVWQLVRDGDKLTMTALNHAGVEKRTTLVSPQDVSAEQVDLRAAFSAMAAKSEKRRDYFVYRINLTKWLLPLWVGQELVFWFFRRMTRRTELVARSACVAFWLMICGWVNWFYFV